MGKKLIVDEIDRLLKPPVGIDRFSQIFKKVLHWRDPESLPAKIIINPDNLHEIIFVPVAEIGGLPVILAELQYNSFPDISLLTLIHRSISKKILYSLLIFITADKNSVMVSWGKYKTESKQEIRTCVYKLDGQSKTMPTILSELLIDLSDTEFDEPHILRVVEKINNAFVKESDVTETFEKLINQLRIIREKYMDAASLARGNLDYKNCDYFNNLADNISDMCKNITRNYEIWTKLIK